MIIWNVRTDVAIDVDFTTSLHFLGIWCVVHRRSFGSAWFSGRSRRCEGRGPRGPNWKAPRGPFVAAPNTNLAECEELCNGGIWRDPRHLDVIAQTLEPLWGGKGGPLGVSTTGLGTLDDGQSLAHRQSLAHHSASVEW